MFENLWRNLRHALRRLARERGFTTVVLVTLALGIGASTAIFSVVDGVLLSPLPFSEPDELVAVWADYSRRGGPEREWLSYPNARDLAAEVEVFEALALYLGWAPTWTGGEETELLFGAQVDPTVFSQVLDVDPALGRGFLPEESQLGAERVILLSQGFWNERFGADPNVVGRVLTLDEEPYTIVGVMPRGFQPPFLPNAQLWSVIQASDASFPGGRANAILRAVARLKEGVGLETARARADAVGAGLEEAYPEANTGVGFTIVPLRADLTGPAQPALWILLGAVGFVLLIVCVNVANLLLARGAARRGELAVRAALGAGRGRLVRELLVESGLLALLGGTLGVAMALVGTDLLVALAPENTPRLYEVAVDGRVLAFAVGATAVAGLLFGLLPSLRVPRIDLQSTLREGRGGSGTSRRAARGRTALVIGQVALALVLLVGAGLLLRSFRELSRFDLGFDEERLLTVRIDLPPSRYPDRAAITAFLGLLEPRLRALPGVRSVGATNTLPMLGLDGDSDFQIEGRPMARPGEETVAWIRRVTPDYFRTMGMELVAGRQFSAADDDEAADVVIINETIAERLFPGENPIGRRVNLNNPPVWREIVGVVENIKNFGIRRPSPNAIYFPYTQASSRAWFQVLRTEGDPEPLIPTVRGAVAELDRGLAVSNARAMTEIVSGSLAQDRFVVALLTGFAALALLLAAVGLYGVVSYSVSRRLREMGVRLSVGAEESDIRRLVMGGSLALTGIGIAVGVAGAIVLTRFMESLLFGVGAIDPVTYIAVAALLASVALLASAGPAWRAARVDPVQVLKTE
jgi:putative ABC transport system permease protein